MAGQEAKEPTQPKNFPEAIKAWQSVIRKAGELDARRQEQITRQKDTITGLRDEVVRMRELCRQNGIDWKEGLP